MTLAVGQTATRALTVTDEHVGSSRRSPATTTRCTSTPLRRGHEVRRLVVQGGLTTGLFHALVAMDMPGPGRCS